MRFKGALACKSTFDQRKKPKNGVEMQERERKEKEQDGKTLVAYEKPYYSKITGPGNVSIISNEETTKRQFLVRQAKKLITRKKSQRKVQLTLSFVTQK